ncbi:Ser/Thr protein kinase SpkA [[Synechococcus] sp. NIES-970]|uniref:serine/threonine protein kinase n=1 Tax=Picosynechococcus sp. NKBG15041c TaxID=1407650 RepID=UPI000414F60D|nr:serine/threonine-protein kinase [Picosynechococcus sp. NKBG15041c]BAW96801.1 Ser/Thr protein kinase SpkA [[Synechococcus] sp. NIES-970]
MTTDPNVNRLLAGRYRLVDLVGQGAMGRVYRGEDTVLGGVTVAVKFLSQTLLNDKMRQRFEREATICALLSEKSIHIVRVKDYGVDDQDVPFYVMEYLEGESLSDVVAHSTMALPRFFGVVRQVCLGMEAAHQGITFKGEQCSIIHRDIKPSNILIMQDASLGELVKVLDFGIARLSQAGAAQTQSFMGTLAYCSPEQMEGKELDQRSDIYSLGITMYEMLTGDMPIMPENNSFGGWYRAHHDTPPIPFDKSLRIPDPLAEIIMCCMAKNPRDRPQTVHNIWQAMAPIAKYYEQQQAETKRSFFTTSQNLQQQNYQTTTPVAGPNDRTRITSSTATPTFQGATVSRQGTPTEKLGTTFTEAICADQAWPADKPQSKIVFPRILPAEPTAIASLWAMLDGQELSKRRFDTRYNQFLFIEAPHPMLLWITVLYNSTEGARWLPCYLDLKTAIGQQMARLLARQGNYRILLFALGHPQRYFHITQATISLKQREQLNRWADIGQKTPASNPAVSKQSLKQEYEKSKGKILMKLAASRTNSNLGGF